MGLKKLKDLFITKRSSILCVLMVALMLITNVPVATVNANENDIDETETEVVYIESLEKEITNTNNERYKLSVSFGQDDKVVLGSKIEANEITKENENYDEYLNRVLDLTKANEYAFKFYSLSIVNDEEKLSLGNKTFRIEDLDGGSSRIIVLDSEDNWLSSKEFEINLNDNPVLVFVDEIKNEEVTKENTEISYELSAEYKEDSEVIGVLNVSELDKEDERYNTYFKDTYINVKDKFVKYINLFELTIDKDEERETDEFETLVKLKVNSDELDFDKVGIVKINNERIKFVESEINNKEISFNLDEETVFALVEYEKEKTLSYGGSDYLITVVYDALANIDYDAELKVSEIKEKDHQYEDVVETTSETLGEENVENASFVRAFDIAIINTNTNKEYEPNSHVKVTIDLLNENISKDNEVSVVHIKDEENSEVLDAEVVDGAVEFNTTSFSIYVVVGDNSEVVTPQYTYIFYKPTGDITEIVTDSGFIVENWSTVYEQMFIQSDNGTTNAQIVKNGETPVAPQLPDTENKAFAGWFEGSHNGTSVAFGKTSYDFNNVSITENKTIYLYARYTNFARVIFHDQYNNSISAYPVMSVRRGELINNTATVRISDVCATYSGDQNLKFYGWSETPVQNPGDSAAILTSDYISISEDKDLYPVFKSYHWLSYYSALTGSGATYVPQVAYFSDQGPASLVVPEWSGHTFLGWFNGELNGNNVIYSTQITEADGSLIPGVVGTGVKVQGSKLILTDDTTLYAKWDDTTTVGYKVIIWKQKTTDPIDTNISNNTYDFVESILKVANTGATVSVDDEYKTRTYTGYTYNRCDNATVVNSSGYTVLNVYYDRSSEYTPSGNSHTLRFVDSVSGLEASTNLPVTYDTVAYNTSITEGNNGGSFVPANPTSGRKSFSFSGWYADENLSTRAFFDKASYDSYQYGKVLYETMPDQDLTIYAGWSADWYVVQIDPNYGTFNGSGGSWFWETIDGDLVQEYTQVTRNYIPSSSGTFYYVKHDRAYYGYSGNEWDQSEPDRDAYYTEDQSIATEDTTYEYAPGVYTYAGWYEVHEDGSETLYDFSKHVDHDLILKLHWKKSGTYYVDYAEGSGTISGSEDSSMYADQASVLIKTGATAPSGYVFKGWRMRNDSTGHIYSVGDTFTMNADYAEIISGKNTVTMEAVYTKVGTTRIIYNPNGGSIDPATFDYGSPTEVSAPVTVKNIEAGQAIISNLVNNSTFTLSDGTGLSRSGLSFVGWSTKANHTASDTLYTPGGEYGVDVNEPLTLYAVWQATVTYHLNTESTTATWNGDWGTGYTYDSVTNTYSQLVYLNNTISKPAIDPIDTNGQMFRYWMSEIDGSTDYDFENPVTGNLDLYAKWNSEITIIAHAVDATTTTLADVTEEAEWTVNNIHVGSSSVVLNGTSHVSQTPADYTFAFAVESNNLSSISEDNKITNLYYNSNQKQVYATYANGSTKALGNHDVYFVYFEKKNISIDYKSMGSDGALSPATGNLPVKAAALLETGKIASFDVTAELTDPLDWADDNTLVYYSYAIGDANAGNAGDINLMTDASDSDTNRPNLQIRNTWKGFQYTTDGSTWINCGYNPALYVIYFEQHPTIVTIEEQTLGDASVANEQFDYLIEVREIETDVSDPSNPVINSDNQLFEGAYVLPNNNGETVQSAILFYKKVGDIETTQKIIVTQSVKAGFDTSIDASGKGTITAAERKWEYTSGSLENDAKVVFTNTKADEIVDVHVAMIDLSTSTIVPDDSLRSNTHTFNIKPNETKAFTTELPSATVFDGDSDVYAFGTVIYGKEVGDIIEVESSDVASISYEKVGNTHELVLKDSKGNTLDELDGFSIYYLYYPMPQIRYVKKADDGSLSLIRGSTDGYSSIETITYNKQTYPQFSINGAEVKQNQTFEIPMKGFKITQDSGKNNFKMPGILDDGVYARYLTYTSIGASDTYAVDYISDLGVNVSSNKVMYLQVVDNELQWSFTGEDGDWNWFAGPLIIYAIYEERGYDLQITKYVPVNVGYNPTFTITVSSSAITKSNYEVEGYNGTPVVTPATSTDEGTIELQIVDGNSLKIKGLAQGSYSVKETENDNYILTAKCGPINGTLEDLDVTNSSMTFDLDREKRLELTNTHKYICKITVNDIEHPFYSLQSAIEYAETNEIYSYEIEMLSDYLMPPVDVPLIKAGYTVELKTADTVGGVYNFDGGKSGIAAGATITRSLDYNSGPLITNRGNLTLENLTIDGNNIEVNDALISNYGNLTTNVGTLLQNANNPTGNGGAIHAASGTVTVNSTIKNCTAKKGAAIYSEGSAITITGTLSGNTAESGGAIYYDGDGAVTISGSANISSNSATNGNGGAIYATAGTITLTSGNIVKNSATGNGGAIYTGNGAVVVDGGTIGGDNNANTAINGSAIFVDTGTATFNGGLVTKNVASSGGAVGIGNESARLYFNNAAKITGNKTNGDDCNVYLDIDTEQMIINADSLNSSAEIGIYVAGDIADNLFQNRGVPGARFASYATDPGTYTVFKNDRLAGVTVTNETASRHLVWGKSVTLLVRYFKQYKDGFPAKASSSWNGELKKDWVTYYLPAGENPISTVGEDIRSKNYFNANTSAFAYAFVDDDSENISFDNYITDINWDNTAGDWSFIKRDGTTVSGSKLVVYFSEPAYINIENNTGFALNITSLSLLNHSVINSTTQTGYGYLYAVNGAVQDTLRPITASDLQIAVGKSVKIYLPGGISNQKYTLEGGFAVGANTTTEIPVTQTGVADKTLKYTNPLDDTRAVFSLSTGKTGSSTGTTVDVIFGGRKPICKVITNIANPNETNVIDKDENDTGGTAYIFANISNAVKFIENNNLPSATVEMLVDYLIPGTDKVEISDGYDITFKTAIGDVEHHYNYSSDETARATISRDNSNKDSFIVISDGLYNTKLDVENLIFDGKNFSGSIAGGVIKTNNTQVSITNCNFQNCIAQDGGGIKIEFTPDDTNYTKATLSVVKCNFTNCKSNGGNGKGGGAIYTNARVFTLTGERDSNGNYISGVFDSCTATNSGAQAGAVFHKIEWAYPGVYRTGSSTNVTDCKFINCKATAAGGLEINSYDVNMENCWFENCQATGRNAGGFNLFIKYLPEGSTNEDMDPSASVTGETKLTVTNSVFKNCTANQRGGGFRSIAHKTTLIDCVFTNNAAGSGSDHYGGGISITNKNATEAIIKGCTIQNCSAYRGGGVYFNASGNPNATLLISDDPNNNFESLISGNIAYNRGGGVYTGAATTLINTHIINNSLTNSTVDNAAGMYIDKALTIGETGAAVDTTVITGNTVSGGGASNLHILSGNNATSVTINCDLSVGSHIGITNPGRASQQFGTSPNSTTNPIWRPYGLADPTPDDPDYYPTFVADNNSVYGIVDRSDSTGVRVIWSGPPICKITDADGNLLYLDGAKKYPAIFDAVEGGTAGSWTSAFGFLQNPTLYRADGSTYPKDNASYPYYVKMLVENYELTSTIYAVYEGYTAANKGPSPAFVATKTIVLTTASSNDSMYPYRGNAGTSCTIIRSGNFKGTMLQVGCNVTLTNITLDGGYKNGLTSTAKGGIIYITSCYCAKCILGEKAVLQNSYTTNYAGGVYVEWSDFEMKGGTIQNCHSSTYGGAINMNSQTKTNSPGPRGYLRLESGNIINCSANNGGGIHVAQGTVTMTAVSIRGCTATTNGGGINFAGSDKSDQEKKLTISGGTISGCTATNGGGIYINNSRELHMSGGFIMGNNASTKGGGIAIGGSSTRLYFSKSPWVSGNTCDASVADGKVNNVELDQNNTSIINSNGIWNGARIGIYVSNAPSSNPYVDRGQENKSFGTFNNANDVNYLYGFINDYNGLKGGLKDGQNTSSDKKIYWIKIFSLEITKLVDSYQNDDNEEFKYRVILTGTANDGTIAENINSTTTEPEKYGSLYFVNGVATKMVVRVNEEPQLVDIVLKSGDSVVGERLPSGLNYTVIEEMTNDQKKVFTQLPDERIYGYIGENQNSTTKNWYLSTAAFESLRPICKISRGSDESQLYTKETIEYNWNDDGVFKTVSYDKYTPAVYKTIEEAFDQANNGTTKLYFKGSTQYFEYTDSSFAIEMLYNCTMASANEAKVGKTITLTTADTYDGEFPYQRSSAVVINRGDFNDESMFTANGKLIVTNIILDGRKSAHSGLAINGGIVNISSNGELTVDGGAILRNSSITGNGGAIYVADNATLNVTGGTINLNAVTGDGLGAGIYLSENGSMNISGSPYFGGTGIYNDGSTIITIGNIKGGTTREDIYMAGHQAEDDDTSADSITVTGNISSGAGTIWVWANESPRYKSLQQFAKIKSGVSVSSDSLKAFRNARPDDITGAAEIGHYLYGIKKSDDVTGLNIYWYGITGSRHVIFRKSASGTYEALSGAKFTIYTNSAGSAVAVDNAGHSLTNLTSDASGVFYVGELNYGTYYAKETVAPSGYNKPSEGYYFVITVDETGVGYKYKEGGVDKIRRDVSPSLPS